MKLNYKRTILVGFAFFLICAFWQAYDNTVPLILTNKFGMSQTWSGVIMALDNVLALFMLPLFGHLSDKCTSPKGRRTPFIVIGTLVAACALVALSFVDNAQLRHLRDVSAIDDPAALSVIYERQKDATLLSPGGESFILGQKFTEEEFTAIRSQTVTEDGEAVTDPAYTNYVVPARQACAEAVTRAHPATVILFVALLLIILLSMATFRSPAVALMPDVTPKPLRSKANAVINLMGSAGGIIVLALGMLFATASVQNSLMSYTGYFGVIAALMLAALVVFMLTVQEPRWAKEMQEQSVAAVHLLERRERNDQRAQQAVVGGGLGRRPGRLQERERGLGGARREGVHLVDPNLEVGHACARADQRCGEKLGREFCERPRPAARHKEPHHVTVGQLADTLGNRVGDGPRLHV